MFKKTCKFLLIFSTLLTILAIASCSPSASSNKSRQWMEDNGKIKVLATTRMISDLVTRIGKEKVDVLSLIDGNLDPHSYELVKGDNEKFIRADLIFYNGLGLEHSPSIYHHLTTAPLSYSFGDYLLKNNSEDILYIDGKPDPHIWMDISIWSTCSDLVLQALIDYDPDNKVFYQENWELCVSEMLSLHKEIFSLMQSIEEEKRFLVTSHDAFHYFTKKYLCSPEEQASGNWKVRFRAPEGLAPDSLLSTTDIQNIINHMSSHKIEVLFLESNVSADSVNKIVSAGKQLGLNLTIAEEPLYADAMGAPGTDADTYLKMIHHNAISIARNLNKAGGQE